MAILSPIVVPIRDGTITLRSATPADASALIALQLEMAREGGGTVYAEDEVDTDPVVRARRVRRAIAAPDDLVIVAESGGAVVGEASFRAGNARRIAHRGLLGVSVSRPWRSRGVGRALVSGIVEWCRARPAIERVCLWVFADNAPALALYRSLGFVEEGRRVGEIRLEPGRYTDDLVMALRVKPIGH